MPFRTTYEETIKLLGFRSGVDLLSGAFGLQAYSSLVFKFMISGAFIAGATAFCTRWIWNPPSAILLLLFLDLANGRYGYQVAKKIRGEGFRWDKFRRMGGIIMSTVIVMACVRNAINSYSYYEKLADLIFGWLFVVKSEKLLAKMVALKVQEQGAIRIFRQAIGALLSSKFGPGLVDSIQPPRPSHPEQPESNPAEKPPTN